LHDIASDGRTLEPDVVFAMGRIAERFAAETASARRTLPDAYDALKGRRWRRLRAAMETAAAPVRDAAPRRAGSRARRAVPVPAPSMESNHSDEPPTMEES